VEVPAFEHLALGPGDLERVLDDLRIRVVVGKHGSFLSTLRWRRPLRPTMGTPSRIGRIRGESPGTIAPDRWINRPPEALATIPGRSDPDPESPKILTLWR